MAAEEIKAEEVKAEDVKEEAKPEERVQIPETLPVLPLDDVVTFPYMILPLLISRERAIAAVDHAIQNNRIIFLATVRESEGEEPSAKDIYDIGTVAMVIRMLKMPDQK